MERVSSHMPQIHLPDASLRKPLTLTNVAPVLLCYYAHAIAAMLPGTFWLRVALLPITLWLAWSSAVTLDIAQYLANTLGVAADPLRISHLNFLFVVRLFCLGQKYPLSLNRTLLAGYVGHSTEVL
jgi:hypothetical protein